MVRHFWIKLQFTQLFMFDQQKKWSFFQHFDIPTKVRREELNLFVSKFFSDSDFYSEAASSSSSSLTLLASTATSTSLSTVPHLECQTNPLRSFGQSLIGNQNVDLGKGKIPASDIFHMTSYKMMSNQWFFKETKWALLPLEVVSRTQIDESYGQRTQNLVH